MNAFAVLATLMLVLLTGGAYADIVEWRDANGIRHFTNNKDDVPATAQGRVLVTERPRPETPAISAPTAAAAAEPPRQAQAVYDYAPLADAYLAGVEQGLALRGSDSVQINAPLAIANAWGGAPALYPTGAPFVTTSFDRGRSRHLTLRMLLQDQFQLDRDGPFAYERLFPVGQTVALNPFLPRGLPHRFPRGARALAQ